MKTNDAGKIAVELTNPITVLVNLYGSPSQRKRQKLNGLQRAIDVNAKHIQFMKRTPRTQDLLTLTAKHHGDKK